MPAGAVLHYKSCLFGLVPYYQPCMLEWCLTIGHAFWCSASLKVMSSGVAPHYRPYLLAWYLTIGHACWSVLQREEEWLQVWCYSYRGAITSDMSADPVPLSDMPAYTVQLYQTGMLGSFIQIHVFVKCFFIRQELWYVTNPPDMPTGKVWLPWVCKTYN